MYSKFQYTVKLIFSSCITVHTNWYEDIGNEAIFLYFSYLSSTHKLPQNTTSLFFILLYLSHYEILITTFADFNKRR